MPCDGAFPSVGPGPQRWFVLHSQLWLQAWMTIGPLPHGEPGALHATLNTDMSMQQTLLAGQFALLWQAMVGFCIEGVALNGLRHA